MDPERLRCTHISVTALFPPLEGLDRAIFSVLWPTSRMAKRATLGGPDHATISALFAKITQRFEFTAFTMLPNGCKMNAGDVAECLMLTDRIQISEVISQHFAASKDRVLDVLSLICERLRIPTFLTLNVRLRGQWPCTGAGPREPIRHPEEGMGPPSLPPGAKSTGPAITLIHDRFLRVTPEQFAALDSPAVTAGIQFICPHPNRLDQVRIEPFPPDPNILLIQLASRYDQPLPATSDIAQRVQDVYDYLFGNVHAFLLTFTS